MNGGGLFGRLGPKGEYGAWPGCGCSGCVLVIAGILLVFAGGIRMLGF